VRRVSVVVDRARDVVAQGERAPLVACIRKYDFGHVYADAGIARSASPAAKRETMARIRRLQ
jgi:hypothetical protein